jgi:hypothetical protein
MMKIMQIDDAIEDHVRTAFGAAIDHNASGLKAALSQVNADDLKIATSYAIYACGYIVLDVFSAQPSDEGIAEMAEYIVEDNKKWVDLGDPAAVAKFLRAAATGDVNFPGVAEEGVVGHSFVIGGYLLSRFRHEGQRWFQYLDAIWNAAQAAES